MAGRFIITETICSLAREIAGEDGVKIVKLLSENHEITDEELAQKTGLHLNQIRKILYSLYDSRLATYRRMRDKSTGWYVYFWRLEEGKVQAYVSRKTRIVLKVLKQRLDFEQSSVFFECGNETCKRLNFDQAFDVGFTCQNCGAPLNQVNNERIIEGLKNEISKLEEKLAAEVES